MCALAYIYCIVYDPSGQTRSSHFETPSPLSNIQISNVDEIENETTYQHIPLKLESSGTERH